VWVCERDRSSEREREMERDREKDRASEKERGREREKRTTLQSSGWRRKDEGAPPSVSMYASFKNFSTWYARQSMSVCPACKVECPVKQSARCREMPRQREVVCNVHGSA
jgi:hypothetical protein